MTIAGGFAHGSGVKLSTHAVVVIAAVLVVGLVATVEVSPLVAIPTLLVTWLLGREARRTESAQSAPAEVSEFPAALRATVDRTMTQLPDGDARRLLSNSLAQARPLLAPHEGTLDDRQETATRDNVLSLVDACCYTALELARLDAASGARDPAASPNAAKQTAAARALLVERLSSAATALTSLYVAGVMHGSAASDRVAQLAEEINADASARSAAANEIHALLGMTDAVLRLSPEDPPPEPHQVRRSINVPHRSPCARERSKRASMCRASSRRPG